MLPVRCFSCGKVLKESWTTLPVEELGKILKRSCCVRMCLTSVDICEEQLKFNVVAGSTTTTGGILFDPSDEKRNSFGAK